MEIKTTYIGINENGIKAIWCGFKPENSTILDEKHILYADEGKVLKHIETQAICYSKIIECGDSLENYIEIDERNINNDITNKNLSTLDSRSEQTL